MLAECGMNETFYSPGRLALFTEEKNSPSPPSNNPLPGINNSSSSAASSASNSPLAQPSSPALTFEQKLWRDRLRSLEDARRLDIAKRIFIKKNYSI